MRAEASMKDLSFRTRGYLPHHEIHGATYFITLRLAGTLPLSVLNKIRSEVQTIRISRSSRKLTQSEEQRLKYLETKKIQEYLDNGIGECWLKEASIAELIKEAIIYHDGTRYISHACCICPIICIGSLHLNDNEE